MIIRILKASLKERLFKGKALPSYKNLRHSPANIEDFLLS